MGVMNQKKFLEQYTYSLGSNFTSFSGEPAAWAPEHPRYWGQERAKIQLNSGRVSTPALSPDDKFIACGIEEDIHVFHVATQERIEVLRGHTGLVGKVRFAPASRYVLVSQSDDGSPMMILWDLDEHGKLVSPGKEKRTADADTVAAKTLESLVSELVTDYGWDPAEKAVCALDDQVRDALHHAIKLHEQEKRVCFEGGLASFGGPVFSADGKTMIYISQNKTTQNGPREVASLPCVNLWDVESRVLQHQLLGHEDAIMWASRSPDNQLVASISWDGTALVWDANSGSCLHVFGPFGGQLWCGAFSPDGKYLAISQGSPKTYIHVYEISTEKPISRFDGFHDWARSMDWSPDGTMLACGGNGSELRIWDPYTGEERMRWCLQFEDRLMNRFATVRKVQFLDGGRMLVFRTSEGTVEIYDFESNLKQQFTRSEEDKIDKFPVSGVVVSNDSRFLVVPDADGILRLWDL